MRDYLATLGKEIVLGKRGENLHLRVVFDISKWRKVYGEGETHLLHQRSGDKTPYPCVVVQDGDKVYWAVMDADVEMAGRGKAELQYIVGDVCVKSAVYTTFSEQGLDTTGAEPGRPEASWVSKVLRVEGKAEKAARDIENMTVTATSVERESTEPLVVKGENPDGTVNLHFNIPPGVSGVYVGSGDPPEGCNVQVNPEGDPGEGVVTGLLEQVDDLEERVTALEEKVAVLEEGGGGGGGEQEVFFAELDKTSLDELNEAYNAGKLLVLRDGELELALYYHGEDEFGFSATTDTSHIRATIDPGREWHVETTALATAEDIGDIDAALDAIIAMQNSMIGGDGV